MVRAARWLARGYYRVGGGVRAQGVFTVQPLPPCRAHAWAGRGKTVTPECSCIADLLLLGRTVCVCVPFRHGAICVQYAHSLIMPVGILGGFGLAAGAVSGGRSSRTSKEIKFLFRHRSFIYSRKFPGSCRESVQEFSCSALNCYRYICTQIHVLQIGM